MSLLEVYRDDQTKKADLFSGQQPANVEDHDSNNAALGNSSSVPKKHTRASAASKGASAAQTAKIAAATTVASSGEDEDGF